MLTASGGPFRERDLATFDSITVEDALDHPTWKMGPKITIDSATMMNKGLEIIEAHFLFGLPGPKIDVVIHPQSAVHSMVEFVDGSLVAQLSLNDMRFPILYALAYPDRVANPFGRLDLVSIGRLDFQALEPERYPAVAVARAALAPGGGAPAVLNAANEVAVAAFLEGKISFPDIVHVVSETCAARGGSRLRPRWPRRRRSTGPRGVARGKSPAGSVAPRPSTDRKEARLTILGNTLALVVVLSILVFVHEFGHFAVAKAFGFPVEVFSFGFGKRLFGFKRNGTDYRVSAIPLGGYVRVIGLGPDESTLADGTSTQTPPTGKRWQRGLILLAGPAMNFVLAVFLHTTVFAVGVKVPAYQLEPPVIKVVEEKGPGAEAGLQPGDRILSINGTKTPRWRDAEFLLGMNARENLEIAVDRGGQSRSLHVTPRAVGPYDIGDAGIYPDFGRNVKARLGIVTAGDRAEKAGLKSGDVIETIGGREIRGSREEIFGKFVAAVEAAAPGPFPVTYTRSGRTATAMVTARREGETWKVGAQVGADLPEVVERFPLGQSYIEGWRRVETDFRMTLSILGRLFRGRASMKSMSGPIEIAKFSGSEARRGAVPLLAFMAGISLQLGIFNLLPIPVLDGGHLFLLALEGVARRDFSLRAKERILSVGFLMLVALLVVALYNDLAKNLPEKWWPF